MDIVSLPIEFKREKIEGRYRLVVVASQRARDLSQGSQPKGQTKAKKMVTIALEEVLSGSVSFITGEAARKAKEEHKRLSFERMAEEAKKRKAMPEVLTELEKEAKAYKESRAYLYEKEERETKKIMEDIFGEKGSAEDSA
ncbi:MAG TPA: DNA-directed RNA polymerase subunit omega [Nitrospiraceae bacterium]|nr:DNA-directed RNA polymerase subunit omega [Nitrospiraceae bacterium]